MTVFPSTRPHPYKTVCISHAAGATLYDTHKNAITDFSSGFGVAALGYSHPKLLHAVNKQMSRLSHAIPSIVSYEGDSAASDAIVEAMGLNDSVALLTTSGAEAIEVALKIAYLQTGNPDVIGISGGYHGQSLGALRVNAHRALGSPIKPIVGSQADFLPFPIKRDAEQTNAVSSDVVLKQLEAMLFHTDSGHRKYGALVIEPMQNLAGYRLIDPDFGMQVCALCARAGVVVISDEIFTGFGRCGDWVVSKKFGITPDIFCVGKALTGGVPGGACVAKKSVMKLLFPDAGAPLHSPTFFNSPILNTSMLTSIEILREEGLLERSREIGETIQRRLSPLISLVPQFKEVRGVGAAQALVFDGSISDLSASEAVRRVTEYMLARNVLALNSGFPQGDVVSLCPPIVISDSQLLNALEIVEGAILSLSELGA